MGVSTVFGDGPVALDTSIFIYFIERNARWLPVLRTLFTAAAAGERSFVTSAVTLLEVLVVPYRNGDLALAERYETLLTRSRGISVVNIDQANLRSAAQLRAAYKLRTPDALQVAAAVRTGCTAFVTNDKRLPDMNRLRVVQLDELL